MDVPSRDWEPDSATLNAVAAVSPEWPHGAIRVRSVARIGIGYGLSGGEIYRVGADCERDSLSFVVKREKGQAVESALRFHRAVGSRVAGLVPACLGGLADPQDDTGVLLLEDIAPASQGDVLEGCTPVEALAAVRMLARLHLASWSTTGETTAAEGSPPWAPRPIGMDEWSARLATAAERFPDVLTPPLVGRLQELPFRVQRALTALRSGATCWIHTDAHLDNILFRPDGTAVLLDWSGATIGPPAIDLARLLTEGLDAGSRIEEAGGLASAYVQELAVAGVSTTIDDLWNTISDGVAVLTLAAVGWARREEDREPLARMRALQANLLRSACAWAASPEMVKPGRVFASA